MMLDSLVRQIGYGLVGSFSDNSKNRGAALYASTIAVAAPGTASSRLHGPWHQHIICHLLRRLRVD